MLQRLMSRFSLENFLSHSNEKTVTEKFVGNTSALCFRKFRREPLCAVFQKISGCEKVYG